VTRPTGPSVARKAKANGTPAKLEATPEKVSSGPRMTRGRPPRTTAADMANPIAQPSSAEATLMRIDIQ
jgi:hypothetical protein